MPISTSSAPKPSNSARPIVGFGASSGVVGDPALQSIQVGDLARLELVAAGEQEFDPSSQVGFFQMQVRELLQLGGQLRGGRSCCDQWGTGIVAPGREKREEVEDLQNVGQPDGVDGVGAEGERARAAEVG